MFFTPALAAAECANPGPPVHAYDAPTLMIDPGVPAARWRRPNSRAQKNVPFSVMSTTVRHALGDMSSDGHREVGGRVVHQHGRQTERVDGGIERRADRLGIADVARDREHRRPERCRSLRAPRRGALPCGSRSTIDAPSRANSAAIALPSPVPAFFQRMTAAGVKVGAPHDLGDRLAAAWTLLNRRNHRKVLVVDDRAAYFGGMNLIDPNEALAKGAKHPLQKSAGWRDVHVRLVGPQVLDVAESFERSWRAEHHKPNRRRSKTYRRALLAATTTRKYSLFR